MHSPIQTFLLLLPLLPPRQPEQPRQEAQEVALKQELVMAPELAEEGLMRALMLLLS
jgi:hypothetical protein